MERLGTLDKLRITVIAEDSVLYESPYLGQHGISLLFEGESGEDTKKILVDVGQNPDILLSNMRAMGIRPATIDTIVLTHCHYDHTQGLVRILSEISREGIKVIAHPRIFRLHFVKQPYRRHVGVMQGDSKEEIEKAGGNLILSEEPIVIMSGVMTTGEIKRRTEFEVMRTELKTIENESVVDDLMLDDISLMACIEDEGLTIVTGCSHAGIINIASQAVELTGCSKIFRIVGGLHLVDASDTVIRRTAEELGRLGIMRICAGHCTGFKAQVALYSAFGENFCPLQTGMRIESKRS